MLKPSKLLLLSLTLAAAPAFAFNLGDAVNSVSSVTGNSQATGETGQMLKALSSQLGVTQPQATGGTAALLGLAKNNLEPSQFSELTKSVPGLEQLTQNSDLLDQASKLLGKGSGSESTSITSLLNNTKDMGDVTSAFNNLGMNAETLNKFAPTLLEYMGKQGLSQPLMSSLTSLWGV
ncbi:DUF2780 domain-containing protein [Pseudomonas sp.]|uniref:DUF2780 domain-containing protein n=1 Tax=Pseudomonas sp. TaxID=306 RepID=UPI003A97BD07